MPTPTACSTAARDSRPAAPPSRGLTLPCPLCGDAEAAVLLDLSDLDTCTCRSCEADFSLAELRGRMARWQRLLDWVGAAPDQEGGAA